MMLFLAAAALAAAGPGTEHVFGNWAVACDNVKRCQATMLMPESWQGDEAPSFAIAREAGPAGPLTITISPVSKAGGVTDILIDRRLIGSGVLRDGTMRLSGATAEGLARAMAAGHALTLRQRTGVVATLSLTGASAALRYIDAEQGRAGTLTALVARGPKSAAAVPGAQPVPRVMAVRPGKGKAATLPAAQIDALREQAKCEREFPSPEEADPHFYRLDARSTLLLLPCGTGAYQRWSAVYVVTGGHAAPAAFDFSGGGDSEGAPAVPLLTEPGWDPETGTLTMGDKGRGLADCRSEARWVWDGARFRMTEYAGLIACRLSGNLMSWYRAEPVWKSR